MKTDGSIFHSMPDSKTIIEATKWVEITNSRTLTPDEEARFHTWLAGDPANQREFDLMNAIWDCTDVLEGEPLPAIEEIPVHRSHTPMTHTGHLRRWFSRLKVSMPVMRPALLTALVLMIVAGIWLSQIGTSSKEFYRTATGEQKTIYLSDRSTVFLDSETEISTSYSGKIRRIDLKTGRALFSVMHDPERPFIVRAGHINVLAMGTEFNVYKRRQGKVSVAVTQGRVQVSDDDTLISNYEKLMQIIEEKKAEPHNELAQKTIIHHRSPQGILDSGQEIIVDQRKKGYEIRKIDPALIDEWRKGRLLFSNTPLIDVIDEINRYLDTKIVIGDDRLKHLPINIIFRIRDRQYFLSALEKSIPIVSEKVTNRQMVIIKRKEPVHSSGT